MDTLASAPITMCLGKVTLAAGTTSTLSNTGTTVYAIRGKAYSKVAMVNVATPTTDWATGVAFLPLLPNYGTVYVVGFDHSANLKAVQGTIVPLDGSGAFINAPQLPSDLPNDFCPIGYIVVKAGSTASAAGWVLGTGNLATPATGITLTYVDVVGLPDRPQIA